MPAGRGPARYAFISFFKALLGAGLLLLPHAFTTVPLGVAIAAFAATGCLVTVNMLLVVRAKHHLQDRLQSASLLGEGRTPLETYADVARAASGSPAVGALIAAVVALLQACFSIGFLLAVKDNAARALGCSQEIALLGAAPILLGLALMERLVDLWQVATLGTIVYVVGVLGYPSTRAVLKLAEGDSAPPTPAGGLQELSLFVGNALYGMDGINLVLPTVASLQKEREDARVVVSAALAAYVAVATLFATLCALAGFGDCGPQSTIVIDCLGGGDDALVAAVRGALALTLVLTYPLQMVVVHELFAEYAGLDGRSGWTRCAARMGAVAMTLLVASQVDSLYALSGVVGSTLLAIVGLIVPPALYLAAAPETSVPEKLGLASVVALGAAIVLAGVSNAW